MHGDDLTRGPLGDTALHICVDMQRMFSEPTAWQTPWMRKVLPAVVALTERHASQTLFTRFVPAQRPGQGHGMWASYYRRWAGMTLEEAGPELLKLVPELAIFAPPAQSFDKFVYSPWINSQLHQRLSERGIDTIVVSGGETDVCVLATVLGAIDWGYRVIVAVDAVCSSADETHDAIMTIYRSRFSEQIETAEVSTILANWP